MGCRLAISCCKVAECCSNEPSRAGVWARAAARLAGYSLSPLPRFPRSGFSIRRSSSTSFCQCFTLLAQNKGNHMNTKTLTVLLQIAALLHIGLICAGASMPKAVNLRGHLTVLPPFIRQLFFIYYGFIGLMLDGFGCLTFVFAPAMAAGDPVARGLG